MSDWLRGLDAWLTREPDSWDDVPADDDHEDEELPERVNDGSPEEDGAS